MRSYGSRGIFGSAMPKSTRTYWNPLSVEHRGEWQAVEGLEGIAEELTLAIDEETGDYTRLTRFVPGADTTHFGSKSHDYPEEIIMLEGRLYDAARRSARTLSHRGRLPRAGDVVSESGRSVLRHPLIPSAESRCSRHTGSPKTRRSSSHLHLPLMHGRSRRSTFEA